MLKRLLYLLFFLDSANLLALPIVFDQNQGNTSYSETESAHFRLYYESDTPHESRLFLDALESAKPSLETWLETLQDRQIPVICSARTNGASFANLITSAIELQSMGLGDRDLAWHEYTHMSMYRHFYNIFGPPGALVHLPWMPAWFLEGLAEALSVSVGSDLQGSIERYHALSGVWPEYDRIHNLYSSDDFGLTGYATAGSFTAWLLRKGSLKEPHFLNHGLQRFFQYTMPWYYPLSANPFSSFLPFDKALHDDFNATGRELYAQYQIEASAYWQAHRRGPFLSGEPHSSKNHPWIPANMVHQEPLPHHPNDVFGLQKWQDRWVGIQRRIEMKTGLNRDDGLVLVNQSGSVTPLVNLPSDEGFTNITTVFPSQSDDLWFFATDKERTKLCVYSNNSLMCPLLTHIPQELSTLGHEIDAIGDTQTIWLSRKTHSLYAETYELLRYSVKDRKLMTQELFQEGAVLRISAKDGDRWALHKSTNRRYISKLDDLGRCLSAYDLDDLPTNLWAKGDGAFVLEFYEGDARSYRLVQASQLAPRPCGAGKNHISPLLVSIRAQEPVSLEVALHKASLWQDESMFPSHTQLAPFHNKAFPQPTPLSHEEKAPWKARPLFAVPMLNAEDPVNYHLGVIGVPFMDEMQNETATLYVGFGIKNLHPSTYFSVESSRFWPTLSASIFHRPAWNGMYVNSSKVRVENSYLHETGINATSTWRWYFTKWEASTGLGLNTAYRSHYLGLYPEYEGMLNEALVFGSVTKDFHLLSATVKWNSRLAPKAINPYYDYNHFEEEASLKIPLYFLDSELLTGVRGSQLIGKKQTLLKEYYMPLTTFVPGTGGSYNQTYFNLTSDSGSLFIPRFGDNTFKAYVDWTMPLVKNIDKLIWILYLERLDFTAFYNYGGAWYNRQAKYNSRFMMAQGYHLDLQMENKGVHFNAGFGVGQVLGGEYQGYAKLGFNAFF